MPSLLILLFMIFFLLESGVGIIGNGFIIIVLGREWVRYWTLPTGAMILASLGISRFFLHWVTIISDFYAYFSPTNSSLYIGSFWTFMNMITLWFTSWLAVFYCVKISSFTHPIFLWLKWRISRFVPWLLLWSLLISTLIFIPNFVKIYDISHLPVTGNYSEKTTWNNRTRAYQRHFFMPLQIFILLINFLFFLVSTISLISSLCQHLGNMQHHSVAPQDPSMQVHITTLKSLFFFLILYTSMILPLIVAATDTISVCSSRFWVWEVVTYAGISIHPAFLILNNSKLRRALKKMLHDPEAA
ncbi:taste receptor type 2 member 134-like [Trichosurus vulpecula]|uniref:taste receptor type 2 member 134-like n=1 Tax=Trichosurus vulpecula TaxID=9337 RepID=UPI00186ACDC6|nr:taste receptor type 2 member 134-like [Trichosurus vulpecula]